MAVNRGTVKRWAKELDSLNEWLRYDDKDEKVTRIYCALCSEHQERLKDMRNYSPAFVNGVVGTALKKDNVRKHTTSEMHRKACNIEREP